MPSQPATLTFGGIPTGSVTFSGQAYNAPCGMVGTAAPTWTSDPLVAQVDPSNAASIHLVFHANGTANVDIDFEGSGTAQCTPTMWVAFKPEVASKISLPTQRTDFSIDLNGDGRVDNQYGNVNGALAGQNLNAQGAMNSAVASGDDLLLITQNSSDGMFQNDSCAGATIVAGVKPMVPPKFDGNDTLTVDPSVAPGMLVGPLTMGAFTSANPATLAAAPPTVSVKLAFGLALVRVPLYGAHISINPAGGAQLNGAIKNSDMQTLVVPGMATGFNAFIAANPMSATAQQLLNIFDNGGKADPSCGSTCKNLDNSCAVAHDNVISACELGTSGLIQNVLAPDVEMFAADGSYHPNPNNTNKNAFSVGVGLNLVGAHY
jgi:hypothetical protein